MPTGTVRWFDRDKGFGFIKPDGSDQDVFVHYTGIQGHAPGYRTLDENQRVTFDIKQADKGPQAINVAVQ